MISLAAITEYLDSYLRIREVPDHANAYNGLQVENSGSVDSIVVAVDASQATIDAVVQRSKSLNRQIAQSLNENGPVLLIVHHGLFWDGAAPMTGRRLRRVRALLDGDIALYGAHIPLDVHPEVGNNAVLARTLGLSDPSWFGDYRGVPLGVAGNLNTGRDELLALLDRELGTHSRLIAGGPARTSRVGVITGAAGDRLLSAHAAGCDTFVTGEGMHHTYFDAMEFGVNLIFSGHYATEQVGVKALGRHLSEQFGIPWEFHDHPTGL